MNLRDKLGIAKDFMSTILMLILIVATIGGGIWLGASIWANATEGQSVSSLPKMPAINKAQYTALMETTGDVFLTNSYDAKKSPEGQGLQVFTLHGIYRVVNGKWVFTDTDFPLDEYYWGEIKIEKRTN